MINRRLEDPNYISAPVLNLTYDEMREQIHREIPEVKAYFTTTVPPSSTEEMRTEKPERLLRELAHRGIITPV